MSLGWPNNTRPTDVRNDARDHHVVRLDSFLGRANCRASNYFRSTGIESGDAIKLEHFVLVLLGIYRATFAKSNVSR